MNIYTLPIHRDTEFLRNISIENTTIDMSKFGFNLPKDKTKRASFIYIRNSCINPLYDFHNCSFEDKSEFLLLFLNNNINVTISELASTWVEILLRYKFNTQDIKNLSIFDINEIDKFILNNKEFIDEIYNLIISIPICAIQYYGKSNNHLEISLNNIKHTDYDKINLFNFIQLMDYDDFILLIQSDEKFKPKYYKKYFDDIDNPYLGILLKKLPFLDILNVMLTTDEEIQDQFLNNIQKVLN